MQQERNGNQITVWVDGAQIVTMEAYEQAIWHTPGASEVYIASNPQFRDDYAVATVADLLGALGYDESDGLTADDVAELTVTLRA